MNYNPFSLEGKTVLITGGSSGIGRTTAIECSRLGAKIIITGRDELRLRETLESLDGEGHQMYVADLSEESQVVALVKELPLIDGFVCNAGISKRVPINFIKEEDLVEIFKVNMIAGFMLTKSIMKSKKMNKNGSIVFVSSKAARQNTPGNSMYAASKAAIESFSRSCAIEYAGRGIRSNAVLPGMVETPLTTKVRLSDEDLTKDKARYLLKRYGRSEEIAWMIIYLLSDASSWVTSSSLIIDGGGQTS